MSEVIYKEEICEVAIYDIANILMAMNFDTPKAYKRAYKNIHNRKGVEIKNE